MKKLAWVRSCQASRLGKELPRLKSLPLSLIIAKWPSKLSARRYVKVAFSLRTMYFSRLHLSLSDGKSAEKTSTFTPYAESSRPNSHTFLSHLCPYSLKKWLLSFWENERNSSQDSYKLYRVVKNSSRQFVWTTSLPLMTKKSSSKLLKSLRKQGMVSLSQRSWQLKVRSWSNGTKMQWSSVNVWMTSLTVIRFFIKRSFPRPKRSNRRVPIWLKHSTSWENT